MKRYLYSIISSLFFLCVNAAGHENLQDDYGTFCTMQRFADANFALVEQLNLQFDAEAARQNYQSPAAYWLQDARHTDPNPSEVLSVDQGFLFDPKTNTLHSKFGAWCFAHDKIYKTAQKYEVSLLPKFDIWQVFRKQLAASYHIEMHELDEMPGLYEICTYYGTQVPIVRYIKLPLQETNMPDPEGVPIEPDIYSLYFGYQSFTDGVYEGAEHNMPHPALVRAYAEQGLRVRRVSPVPFEHLLVLWREMKRRYQIEKQEGDADGLL